MPSRAAPKSSAPLSKGTAKGTANKPTAEDAVDAGAPLEGLSLEFEVPDSAWRLRYTRRTSGCQIGKFDLYMLPPSSLKTKLKRYRSFKELGDDPLVTESDTAKVREHDRAMRAELAEQYPYTPRKESPYQSKMKDTENALLRTKLAELGYEIKEVQPDGHCLFNAVLDQMTCCKVETAAVMENGQPTAHSHRSLRSLAASYLREHRDHFIQFFALDGEGEAWFQVKKSGKAEDAFEKYCSDLERTKMWGGQHELLALAHSLKRSIVVYSMHQVRDKPGEYEMHSSELPDPTTGTRYEGEPLRLSYHVHQYADAEHFNSVVVKSASSISPAGGPL